jgi:hypothetical protein
MYRTGLYEMLFPEQHEILQRYRTHIEEEINTTGMDEAEMLELGVAHPKHDATGKRNYLAYVLKMMLFAMRCRNRLGESHAIRCVFIC